MGAAVPMFPLGSVLFPGMPLPLHVFEPRYRALVQDCLDGDRTFGVVLIERGSEVGGGDARASVGTLAEIVEAARFEDGRWAIGAVGRRRLRVLGWEPEDPYPRARVEDWPDEPGAPDPAAVAPVTASLRRLLGLAAEVGLAVPPATIELSADPAVAVDQMAGVAPLGPLDRYDLLCAPGSEARLVLLAEQVGQQIELLEGRLAMTDGDDGFGEGFGDRPGGL